MKKEITKNDRRAFQKVKKCDCNKFTKDFKEQYPSKGVEHLINIGVIDCKSMRNYLLVLRIKELIGEENGYTMAYCIFTASIEFEISNRQAYNIYRDNMKAVKL